jgi:hypothetical protein
MKELVKKMKEYALRHPLDPIEALRKGVDMKQYQKSFDFEGYDILVTLSLDIISQRKAWHASFGTQKSGLELPNRILEQLKGVFLPCENKTMEIPSMMHGKMVRQFLEFV